MRKHTRRHNRSDNHLTPKHVVRKLERDRLSVFEEIDLLHQSDKAASAEGDAIIRRGKSATDNKAFHDSILWNRNVRKVWIRRELELSVQTEILKVYLQNA